MKNIIYPTDENLHDHDARSEPFHTLYHLTEDHTKLEILEALQLLCEADSELTDSCPECVEREAWLAIHLELLLGAYAGRFPRIV